MRAVLFEVEVTEAPIDRDRALATLARSAGRRGFLIAFDLLGDRAEAEDAVQEALARACEGYERLRDRAALEGWFFRVLTNLCMRSLRRKGIKRRLQRWLGIDVVVRKRAEGETEVDIVDRVAPADERLATASETARTLAALDDLAPMQRAALVLRYGHDRSVAEVAELLGVGTGTVKTHLVRGLAHLRQRVEVDHEVGLRRDPRANRGR